MPLQGTLPPSVGSRTIASSASFRTRPRKARHPVNQLAPRPQKRGFPGTTRGEGLENAAPEGGPFQQQPKRRCLEPVGRDELNEQQAHAAAKYLNVLTQLPPLETLINEARQPLLPARPANAPSKKTLVLDMDHTMVHCVECSFDEYCRARRNREGYLSIGGDATYKFTKRPHLEYFLDRVSQKYEVVVFTAGTQAYAKPLLDLLDPSRTIFAHRLYRDSCLRVFNPSRMSALIVKDLSALGRDLASTFIVDDTHTVFSYQLDNGIPVSSWEGDKDDLELLNLLPLMNKLEKVPDVRPVIAGRFPLHKVVREAMSRAPDRFKCAQDVPPAVYRTGTYGTPGTREAVGVYRGALPSASLCDTGSLELLAAMATDGFDVFDPCGDVIMTDSDDGASGFQIADLTRCDTMELAEGQTLHQEPEMSKEEQAWVGLMEDPDSHEFKANLSSTLASPGCIQQNPAVYPVPTLSRCSSRSGPELAAPLTGTHPSCVEVLPVPRSAGIPACVEASPMSRSAGVPACVEVSPLSRSAGVPACVEPSPLSCSAEFPAKAASQSIIRPTLVAPSLSSASEEIRPTSAAPSLTAASEEIRPTSAAPSLSAASEGAQAASPLVIDATAATPPDSAASEEGQPPLPVLPGSRHPPPQLEDGQRLTRPILQEASSPLLSRAGHRPPQSEEGQRLTHPTLQEASSPLFSQAERDGFITPPPSPRPYPRAPVMRPRAATSDQGEPGDLRDPLAAADSDGAAPVCQETGASGPAPSSPADLAVLLGTLLREKVACLSPCASLVLLEKLKDRPIRSIVSQYLSHRGLSV